ncbi:MAG: S8 family serine peptidase [Myxococcales bacterium]|nr:S8 family serine peptidase [Myxococcales bacterium]
MPELETFYRLEVADDARAEAVASQLAAANGVAGAYVQPEPVLAVLAESDINRAVPSADPAPPATPNFEPRQLYRAAAPGGVDVAFAWSVPGGRGAGVNVIDCEGAWRLTHEDLRQNQAGVIGPQTQDLQWRNHGTAVCSEIGGDLNGFGVTGIAPDATFRGSSIFGPGGLAAAIRAAADALRAGDIILLEVQYGHPTRGFTSVEWWPADFAAIQYAVGRGVIVVEAAGNGGNNLDDVVYDTPLPGFPASWSNPFRRGARDSGAILVGAGAPPPGTHGRNWGPDRSRLDFSNYGSAVDVQGWGREVTAAGYGDLQGGANEDLWYTDTFSGTSSASPIVVGVLACVQGARRAARQTLLTPASARSLLRSTGSPQQDAPGRPATQRIGNRPNLRALIRPKTSLADGAAKKLRDDNGAKKRLDDGGGIKKRRDDVGVKKRVDDVKRPGFDLPPSGPADPGVGSGAEQPFILATPHHAGEDAATAAQADAVVAVAARLAETDQALAHAVALVARLEREREELAAQLGALSHGETPVE